MPIERQRWVPVSTWDALNRQMSRTVDVLDSSLRYDLRQVSASLSVVLTYPRTVYLVTTTGGTVTLTLPLAATVVGMRVEAKKMTAANSVTFATSGSDTIDGAATCSFTTQYAARSVLSTGATWVIV